MITLQQNVIAIEAAREMYYRSAEYNGIVPEPWGRLTPEARQNLVDTAHRVLEYLTPASRCIIPFPLQSSPSDGESR